HRDRAQQLATSQQDSESQLQKLVTDRDELLAQKDSEINKWREAFQNEQVEKEKLRDELERVRKDLEGKIAEFETTVQFLRQRLNAVENMSFDKPDGKIVRINNTTRDVWIDLGSADNLRKQVGFSVYIQSHSGVGRGTGDIKAKVEVTEIRGPHTAICKILDDDISRPIQEGDPIYSPLWEKGAQELFSFAGILDMNSDGESDRELLHNVLDNAGAGIEVELNDQGIREPADGRVTVRSKFFVVGEAPDPTKFAGFSEKQAEMKRVLEELNALEKEALRSGVRIVRFKDFLNYIGHEPQQRLFVAGQERPFNLKSGARSTGVDEVLGGNRASTGQTSSRFRNDRRPGQDSSNGTTSELFRQ
ncbi:MAG: hypothetical protein KDA80_18815, partial [Planctomycetaceae bacterium]|nr:hypothetical protein [Planctomycetaceae bacterium]